MLIQILSGSGRATQHMQRESHSTCCLCARNISSWWMDVPSYSQKHDKHAKGLEGPVIVNNKVMSLKKTAKEQ